MKFNLERHVLKLNTLILKYNVMTDPRKGARGEGGGGLSNGIYNEY